MEEIVNLIVNQGLGVACVGYLIYFQNTTMKQMLDALSLIKEELVEIKSTINHYHGNE